MKYIKTGKCIFCGREEPDATYNCVPHVLPKSLGCHVTGYDVCDDCNHFFGTHQPEDTPVPCSIEETVKEIFGLSRFMFNLTLKPNDKSKIKSRFFSFYHSSNKLKIKDSFKFNTPWRLKFTKMFKRGLCEMFLQSYHIEEGKDANDPKFDSLRRFARYGEGDVVIYYLANNGIYLTEQNLSNPQFHFSESQFRKIETLGTYDLYLGGHYLIMEVTDFAKNNRDFIVQTAYKEFHIGGFVYRDIEILNDISQIDFSLRKLYGSNGRCGTAAALSL